MLQITVTVEIDRPPAQVFDYIANFENNPEWQSGMQSATFTSEGPLRVGSTYSQVAKFLGRRVETDFEVVGYEPGQTIKIVSVAGSFPITVTRTVEPNERGSNVTALVQGEGSGFFRVAEPLLTWMVRRQVTQDYARLKQLLERD